MRMQTYMQKSFASVTRSWCSLSEDQLLPMHEIGIHCAKISLFRWHLTLSKIWLSLCCRLSQACFLHLKCCLISPEDHFCLLKLHDSLTESSLLPTHITRHRPRAGPPLLIDKILHSVNIKNHYTINNYWYAIDSNHVIVLKVYRTTVSGRSLHYIKVLMFLRTLTDRSSTVLIFIQTFTDRSSNVLISIQCWQKKE